MICLNSHGVTSQTTTLRRIFAVATLISTTFCAQAQVEQPDPTSVSNARTEASLPQARPLDGAYERTMHKEKMVLTKDHLREADVFYEKRIWRVIDIREKMNQPFAYPKQPLINILTDAIQQGETVAYSTTTGDNFETPMTKKEFQQTISSIDTIIRYNSETYVEEPIIVHNELNPEDIKRFRIKEVWLFDKESGTLQSHILGIAPIKEVKDNNGNFRYEQPMFWAYYPALRQVLARYEAFNPLNEAQRMTWEDVFEMRLFSSYITKESNVQDRRIQDYKQGVDALLEADNIKQTVFNFEHDLWAN